MPPWGYSGKFHYKRHNIVILDRFFYKPVAPRHFGHVAGIMVLISRRSDDQNGDMFRRGIALEFAANLITVQIRHIEVQYHEIRNVVLDPEQRFLA